MIRWCYAFVDRPRDRYAAACAFWAAVTGTTLSPPRGRHREFATLLPGGGDAYAKTQAVASGGGGTHLDLATEDVAAMVAAATRLGARVVAEPDGYAVLRSPGGLAFCAVPWHGEATRPAPVSAPDGSRSRLDQVAVDVAPAAFEAEADFWAALTGWPSHAGSMSEFRVVQQPPELPLRLLPQRLGEDRPTGAHLDIACADREATRAYHESLGASVVAYQPNWIVMRDPAGVAYCLTGRDPDTGRLPA